MDRETAKMYESKVASLLNEVNQTGVAFLSLVEENTFILLYFFKQECWFRLNV